MRVVSVLMVSMIIILCNVGMVIVICWVGIFVLVLVLIIGIVNYRLMVISRLMFSDYVIVCVGIFFSVRVSIIVSVGKVGMM